MILSLDLGTTGNRAIVFDKKLRVLASVYEEFPQYFPKPGWVEHDPMLIWSGVRKILQKVNHRLPAKKITALGITNQRETVLLWDKKTGKPIYNAIVWQCRRTAPLCEALKRQGAEAVVREKTGLCLDPYFSASKIAWILDNVKGARRKALAGHLITGTIDSWILWNLTGGKVHATDTSNASRTMLFDIRKKRWDDELCQLFRIPRHLLPSVLPSSGFFGISDKKILGEDLPVTAMIGDQQAASFAQGCSDPSVIKNTYGTGLFLLRNTKKKIVRSKNLISTVAWSIGCLDKTEYAVEGSVFTGGAAIQWLRDGLNILHDAGESEALAKAVLDNGGIVFVPALTGLGAPYWDASARGSIFGITRGTRRSHIARAALESLAFQTRDILEIMNKEAGSRLECLRVDGGASANNFLMQFQADILGIPVERPEVLQTTALGAAELAGLGADFWSDSADLNGLRKIERVFVPEMSPTSTNKLYKRWKEAVNRSRHWNSQRYEKLG